MNPNFSNKGTVSTLGTVVVECDTRTRKRIDVMKFVNPSLVYEITIEIYDAYTSTTVLMTQMTLAAGDHLIEGDPIYLEQGDKITVTCDVNGTSFVITGENIDLKKR